MKLHATANDLLIEERERLISGSVNIYNCEFTFDKIWDGYAVNAVFSTGNRTVMMAVVDGACAIPVEVLRPNAKFRVGIVGVKGKITRPTVYSDWVTVEQGARINATAGNEPSQSIFEQWMQLVGQAEEWANISEGWARLANTYAGTSKACADNSKAHADNSKIHAGDSLFYAKVAKWYAEQISKIVGVPLPPPDIDGDGEPDPIDPNTGLPKPPGKDEDGDGLTDTPAVPETPDIPDVPDVPPLDPDSGNGDVPGDEPEEPDVPDDPGGDTVTLTLQEKTAVPDSVDVHVTADEGYDALAKVIVEAANNLKAKNIRKGVTMFGITGTLEMEE